MDKAHKIKTSFIFLLFCSLFAGALVNLYILQIRQHIFFVDLGTQQYYCTITTYPPRASILDRYGSPLALNKETLSAFMMPHRIKDQTGLKDFLKKHFPEAHERLLKKPSSQFLYIKRKLSSTEQELIKQYNLKDIHLLSEPNRFYPIEASGIITGITDTDNKGLFGIELAFNDQLAGQPATTILEKDARSGLFYFSKQTKTEQVSGNPVQLTIDGNLQFLVQEELYTAAKRFDSTEG